ncbi:hypothetical protein [Actinomadura pelletieri]
MQAIDERDAGAVVDYAHAALDDEPRMCPKVRVLALVHLGHGITMAGDRPAADAAFDRAEMLKMTAWRRSPAQEKKLKQVQVYLPRVDDPTRGAWRGLGALIAGRADGGRAAQGGAHGRPASSPVTSVRPSPHLCSPRTGMVPPAG